MIESGSVRLACVLVLAVLVAVVAAGSGDKDVSGKKMVFKVKSSNKVTIKKAVDDWSRARFTAKETAQRFAEIKTSERSAARGILNAFSVMQFIELNLYNSKTDCADEQLKKRDQFCSSIKMAVGAGSKMLVGNLVEYCTKVTAELRDHCSAKAAKRAAKKVPKRHH